MASMTGFGPEHRFREQWCPIERRRKQTQLFDFFGLVFVLLAILDLTPI
jgi:hypothetical protein